jgi:hypothetical protein
VHNWGFLESIFEAIFTKIENIWLFSFYLIVLWLLFFCSLFRLHSWDVNWHPSLPFRRWSVEYCKGLVWWQVIWSKCNTLQWKFQDCSDTISITIDALSSGAPQYITETYYLCAAPEISVLPFIHVTGLLEYFVHCLLFQTEYYVLVNESVSLLRYEAGEVVFNCIL